MAGVCCGTALDLLTWLHPHYMPTEATLLAHFVGGETEAQSGRHPRWGGEELQLGGWPSLGPWPCSVRHLSSAIGLGAGRGLRPPFSSESSSSVPCLPQIKPLRRAGVRRGCCSLRWGVPYSPSPTAGAALTSSSSLLCPAAGLRPPLGRLQAQSSQHIKKQSHLASSFCKGPEVTSENGLLVTSPRKPHKIMQIKRFKTSCSLKEHLRNCPGHEGCAYPRSHQVSEGCHFTKVVCVIPPVVELGGVARPHSGAGRRVDGPKRGLRFCLHAEKYRRKH